MLIYVQLNYYRKFDHFHLSVYSLKVQVVPVTNIQLILDIFVHAKEVISFTVYLSYVNNMPMLLINFSSLFSAVTLAHTYILHV